MRYLVAILIVMGAIADPGSGIGCLHAAASQGLAAYDLECEARVDPIGVDVRHPRFSWKLRSGVQGDVQTAYQILVASTQARLTDGEADLWNSGVVPSADTAWIQYSGTPLRSFEECFWAVRVWSVDGPKPLTSAARWTTGILDAADRKGQWISSASNALVSGPMPIFRKELVIPRMPQRALLLVSGLGFAEVHVNGKRVTSAVLEPAWTNYRASVLYETYDVTSLLNEGGNAIGVMLGNGFFNEVGGRYAKYTGSFGAPRLWLQVHLQLADGKRMDIGSDTSWRVHPGPITFSDIYGGEDYDARLEQAGWDTSGFNDKDWRSAAGTDGPGGVLQADASPEAHVGQEFATTHITHPRTGVSVYDLGQNFAGWPAIRVNGPPGSTVRLTPGELLDTNGMVSQRSSGGPTSFSYVLKGSGIEAWTPRFSYYGFRYLQVEGSAVVQSVRGQFVYLDVARTGSFHSSNKLLNQVHALIDAAVRSNLQHVLTDCPHREKLGWLEQSYLMGPSLVYDWDLRTVLPKIVRDIQDAQGSSGLIPDIAPEYVTFGGGFRDSPEWGSAGILLPWLAWQYYGDRDLLGRAYSMMGAYAEYLRLQTQNGLLLHGLGDWYDVAPGPPGPSKLTPAGVTGTALYFHDLEVLAEIAGLLGRSPDQNHFANEAEQERRRFQAAFFHPDEQLYASGSQTAQAMPLELGIVPAAARTSVLEHLVDDVKAKGHHTTAGDIGYRYVIEALMNAGRSDVIFDMATEKTAPSYAGQIAAGATSLTEAWDANPDSSQNHLMLGHIEEWFYGGLGGIRLDPASRELRHILIRPEPVGDLRNVDASWETFRGPVAVHWDLTGHRFHMKVSIPPGVTADVAVPVGEGEQIRASGINDFAARKEAGRMVYSVGSGKYEFEGLL